jgi:hypothetical protein
MGIRSVLLGALLGREAAERTNQADPLPLSYQQLEAKLKKVEEQNDELREDTLDDFTDSPTGRLPTQEPTSIDSWRQMAAGLLDSGMTPMSASLVAPKEGKAKSCDCLVLQANNAECGGRFKDNHRAWGGRQSYSRLDNKYVLFYDGGSKNWIVSSKHNPAAYEVCLVAQSSGENVRPNGLPRDASWFYHATEPVTVKLWCDVCWMVPTYSPTAPMPFLHPLEWKPKLPAVTLYPTAKPTRGHYFRETQKELWGAEGLTPTFQPTWDSNLVPTAALLSIHKLVRQSQGTLRGISRTSEAMTNQETWQKRTPAIISERIVTNMAALLGGSRSPTTPPTPNPTAYPTPDRWLLPSAAPTKYVYGWEEMQKRSGHDDDDDFHQAPEP